VLDGQALKDAIVFQVEFYFSRENLLRDTYLQSLFDAEQFVALSVLAQFNKLKTLTTDLAVIADALRGSRLVELDASGARVKPRPRPQRNTIILREISSSAPAASISALFAGGPKVVEVRPEVGDNWFVVLERFGDFLLVISILKRFSFLSLLVRTLLLMR
jgi:la-related protein 4